MRKVNSGEAGKTWMHTGHLWSSSDDVFSHVCHNQLYDPVCVHHVHPVVSFRCMACTASCYSCRCISPSVVYLAQYPWFTMYRAGYLFCNAIHTNFRECLYHVATADSIAYRELSTTYMFTAWCLGTPVCGDCGLYRAPFTCLSVMCGCRVPNVTLLKLFSA